MSSIYLMSYTILIFINMAVLLKSTQVSPGKWSTYLSRAQNPTLKLAITTTILLVFSFICVFGYAVGYILYLCRDKSDTPECKWIDLCINMLNKTYIL